MGLFITRCPVGHREQTWIEESMSWFRTTFGAGTLSRAVVLPTPEFFPGPYSGTAADIPEMVRRVCQHTGVDPDMISVELHGDSTEAELARATGLTYQSESVAGHYRRVRGRAGRPGAPSPTC